MGIQNFPAVLQPIIQQGFLEHGFQAAMRSRLAYRAIADRIPIPVGIGESVTKTRAGLKPAATTPATPSANTNLDNGITPSGWGVEQYTVGMSMYRDSIDLNMVTNTVGIASQFVQNAVVNGEQASRTLDELARNALFASYFGGNTRVRVTLGSAGVTISVDDVRGFENAFYVAGFTSAAAAIAAGSTPMFSAVSSGNTLLCTVGASTYTLNGTARDGSNVSTTPGGFSGTLTLTTSVTVSDGTAGNTVSAATAPTVIRPSGRGNTSLLAAGDLLTMDNLLDAVATLRANAVPEVEGAYNCYLDPKSGRQLFDDSMYRQLFQGATSGNPDWRAGMVSPMVGLRFIPTTEAYVQAHPSIAGAVVRRPIVCGQGALIEGDFAGMAAQDVAPADSLISMVDSVVMVTREPLDRLQQIIAQSWYWIGGFCTPSDITTNSNTVPTASNATFKRAVMIEHIS